MDLVAGVRKEGSRGGRDAFKWEDVKDDPQRENYLGHSLMAPVGRWQKNKDLGWYAKGDSSQAAVDAANARAEEIRRIKEAEQDALSEALGFKVEPRLRDHQVAGPKEVEKAIKEAADGEEEGGKGVGFGVYAGGVANSEDVGERLVGLMGEKGGLEGGNIKREKKRRRSRSREKPKERRRRSHSRDRDGDRDHERRRRERHDEGRSHQRRLRERSSERHHRHRHSRSRSYDRRRTADDLEYSRRSLRERSYSPQPSRRRERSRDRKSPQRFRHSERSTDGYSSQPPRRERSRDGKSPQRLRLLEKSRNEYSPPPPRRRERSRDRYSPQPSRHREISTDRDRDRELWR